MREAASALEYMHNQRYVHGNFKEAHILVSPDVHALLCGFTLSGTPELIESERLLRGAGTGQYMSPELWEGQSRTFESDVYAFGITLAQVSFLQPH